MQQQQINADQADEQDQCGSALTAAFELREAS
jgi:hypothetical protein